MRNRQFVRSLIPRVDMGSSLIGLWLFHDTVPLKAITRDEECLASKLTPRRSRQFRHSRGCVRYALSELWQIAALDIPLEALPGKPPKLADGWGFVSFSHCKDALLVGWSHKQIGVDIERLDRSFDAFKLAKKYFTVNEQKSIINLEPEAFRKSVLQKWITKEAAIKWQKGTLSADLKFLDCRLKKSTVVHSRLGYSLLVHNACHHDWEIAVVSDSSEEHFRPMICIN